MADGYYGDEADGNFFTKQTAVVKRFLPSLFNIKVVCTFFIETIIIIIQIIWKIIIWEIIIYCL